MADPMKRVLSACLLVFAMSAASAQQAPRPICAEDPGFGDFDFWVGEWDVYSNDEKRQHQGTNSITKHYHDCLIQESWKGDQGGDGFSINYYNPVEKQWRQVWVANGYSIDYTGGLNDDGAMELTGQIYSYRRNSSTDFRGIWTPQDDGTVIQHFDLFDKEAKEWKVWFEGLYVRKTDSAG